MSGEHRYHSAPATDEYRENFDRIFRGKRAEDECAGLNLDEIAFYDKYGYSECGYALVGQPDGSLKGEEFKRPKTLAEAIEPDGTINAPGRAIHGLSKHSPARGMLGRDGT